MYKYLYKNQLPQYNLLQGKLLNMAHIDIKMLKLDNVLQVGINQYMAKMYYIKAEM